MHGRVAQCLISIADVDPMLSAFTICLFPLIQLMMKNSISIAVSIPSSEFTMAAYYTENIRHLQSAMNQLTAAVEDHHTTIIGLFHKFMESKVLSINYLKHIYIAFEIRIIYIYHYTHRSSTLAHTWRLNPQLENQGGVLGQKKQVVLKVRPHRRSIQHNHQIYMTEINISYNFIDPGKRALNT